MQPGLKPANNLIPREAFFFFPKDEQFLVTSKERIRIIFGGKIQFSDEEKKKIADFKEAVRALPEGASLGDPV